MKNSISTPMIADNNRVNRGNNQSNNIFNNNYNNKPNNYSNNQSSSNLSNNQKIFTPFSNPQRSPEGIKVFQNKRRYNPITDEYYNDIDNALNNNNTSNNTTNTINQNSFNNKTNNKAKNNLDQNNSSDISGGLDQLKNVLISRGPKSIFNFQRMLSIYDRNRSGQISLDDFITIFQTYNLNFTNSEIQNIFQIFDTNQTGVINYDILLNNLIGQMNERRLLAVKKVFDSFNKNENGEVLLSEIKQKYNSARHPDVVKEKKNKEEIYGEFLDKLEIFREYNDNLKSSFSTTMNFNEFVMFYNEISMNIKDDNLFDYLINNCWDLDRISGNNVNNNDIWNNNNDNNYNNRNNNYEKNIRARTGKQIMNMNNRGF